jgi:hypothetical protein
MFFGLRVCSNDRDANGRNERRPVCRAGPAKPRVLKTLLGARAVLNLVFGVFFIAVTASDPAQNFQHSGVYLVADGLAALLVAGMLYRTPHPASLRAMMGADALARLAFGLWFLLVPTLHSFVLTRLFVLLIVCAAALIIGFTGLWMPLRLRSGASWPMLVASAALVVYAVALFIVFPDVDGMRALLGIYLLALSAALVAASLRVPRG